jgi:uncharacterized repeat protein (TIGR03803 family)
MPTMRPKLSRPSVRLLHTLACVSLLAAPLLAHGQAATPAVSAIVAFSASEPNGGIVVGADGGLYGTTSSASSVTGGLIYRSSADGLLVKTIYQMSTSEAYAPLAGLLVGSDGLLYGTTSLGAVGVVANTTGTVFRIKTDGTGFTILHRFAPWSESNVNNNAINADGAFPETALIEGSDGFLYGVTRAGGPHGTGAVFKVSRDGTSFKVLHTFAAVTSDANAAVPINLDGAAPLGVLLQGADGFIYGTTSAGGENGRGTIFRVGTDGSGFQLQHVFAALTGSASPQVNVGGASPLAGLADGKDGRFYGVASGGGTNGFGTIFAFDPVGRLLSVMYDFDDTSGATPAGSLLLGSDTRLYGTTAGGGTTSGGGKSNLGTIFSIARDGTGFTKLHSFDNSQGANPRGRLLQTNATTLIGVATTGGRCGQGTMFQYSSTGATVVGDTGCGQKKGNNGGGVTTPALLLLIGTLGLARARRRR